MKEVPAYRGVFGPTFWSFAVSKQLTEIVLRVYTSPLATSIPTYQLHPAGIQVNTESNIVNDLSKMAEIFQQRVSVDEGVGFPCERTDSECYAGPVFTGRN